MSNYTPTTEEVRNEYLCALSTTDIGDAEEQFDRWLAEVKAEAWEEGMYAGKADDYFGDPDNPYRQGE